ncbi:efflux transporter outer membrane subunit [Dichelobacter nodosus]|uniref:Outer membrane multidrug efflux protein n=1 Tax=Dichelobacter nodosus (strain VCS1703A) TaxID=246195 RepID=A5EXF9_DICNV|nr:efflux transporter outer membrane subunit [Dichelobacter nodosus]ABQ13433.1 outer membrane multidrug efflux protein [Dichelobacter nodosus VCS1703A]AXM45963.1 transporter [Dichelobacter nodosus]TGA64585.1 efflux transporter outer membrane subunit [Dichelobacter nodosus]
MKKPVYSLSLAVFLAACSFVPDYEQPTVALEQQWIKTALDEQTTATASDLGWREYFRDPQLQTLIAAALQHNHDLKQAALTVERAAAQYGIAEKNELPVIALNSEVNRAGNVRGAETNYRVGVGFSNFELDFFGRVRAMTTAALNHYLQTREARDSAQLAVIQGVAKTYYAARINQALMDLSKQVVQSRQKSAELARLQYQAGVINETILHGYESAIAAAEANYHGYRRSYQQALNGLSSLVGMPYQQLNVPAAGGLDQAFSALTVPAGLPSALLEKRPDVRAAEYALKAANANIGAARAALFPKISLTGSLGYLSTELDHLLDEPHRAWSITPAVMLPIFDRGLLNAQVKVSELNQKIVVEEYQKTLQTAFQEIADILIARETYAEQYQAAQKAATAQNEVLRLEKLRFNTGVSDGLALLEAERNSFQTQERVLQVQLGLLTNLVSFYTAMGGGLQEYGAQLPDIK